jgi:putative molybdopterin biosynthesis protein
LAKRYLHTIAKEEAIKKILDSVDALPGEESIPSPQARGRITSGPIEAIISNPPFTCSAMDGFAVNFELTLSADLDSPVSLQKTSQAYPVNTGDPLPVWTNAVIMVEDIEDSPAAVVIRKPAFLWQHVRMVGEDVIQGDLLFPTNHFITAYDIGVLLGAGIKEVKVRPKPRLLIIPTGKELLDIYEEPLEELAERGRLLDFNSYTLSAIAEEIGFQTSKTSIARTKDDLRTMVQKGIQDCDVLIINAGSSAGTEDFTESIIQEFGHVVFHGVSMMPGKPTLFGLIQGKPVFGIPGYPVSAIVSFKTFLEPLFERLAQTTLSTRIVPCKTPYKIPSTLGVEEVIRVNLVKKDNEYFAYPLSRGASIFSSVSRADALLRISGSIEGYGENENIFCELIRNEEEIPRRIHIIGSHDLSLDIMRDIISARHPGLDLISTHVGSLSGIMAVRNGVTDITTTHILDENEKQYNIPAITKYLPDRQVALINIARRVQGLVVRKGNPKGIRGVTDLARDDVTFVNRQFGSGTRILLDAMLKGQAVDKRAIHGYDREEATHAAVGILVKEGIADVGIAIYAVAKIFSLDFIPLAEEEYDLLVTKAFTADNRFLTLMEAMNSKEFSDRLNAFGGYSTADTGKTKYVT